MKKVAAAAVALALTLTAGGAALAEVPSVTKVTDYLFEITCTDYEKNLPAVNEYFWKYNPKMGGCSSVQNGMLRGRNYDWTYDEGPEFVIHVPANAQGRHASIGVAATTEMTAAEVESGFPAVTESGISVYDLIPYLTLDGINDAGLTVNINVVGYEEMGEYVLKGKCEDATCPIMVPRLILDSCGSIDEALELMAGLDIFSVGNAEEAHYMISGPQSPSDPTFNTVVVELIPDENKHYQLSVIDYNKGDFVDNKPIMTNFHLTGFDGTVESATRHPMGLERYWILNENFGQGSTVKGMLDLMKKVFYTRFYDLYSDHFWYSEVTGGELDMTCTGAENLHGDPDAAGPFADAVRDAMAKYNVMERCNDTWHTVHTSVYDIEHKTLYVMPQEGGFSYEFRLEQ
ncbi:MAG: hypothetical protein CW338_09255 [Clostridiales bacterium]|nr:hypothetical protein [Clostridiales bacterium]